MAVNGARTGTNVLGLAPSPRERTYDKVPVNPPAAVVRGLVQRTKICPAVVLVFSTSTLVSRAARPATATQASCEAMLFPPAGSGNSA